jgi:hypothetical protein
MAVDYSQYRITRYFDNTYGYWRWTLRDHPLFPGLKHVNEHRMIVAEREGRILTRADIVHHDNENKTDNTPSNLILTTRAEHAKHHHTGSKRDGAARTNMARSAKERANRPEERARSSERAARQWAEGNLGRKR